MKSIINPVKKNFPRNISLASVATTVWLLIGNFEASAASQYWDNNGLSTPGNGNWDTSTPNWAPTNALTSSPAVFTSGNFAQFAAGSGTISVLNITMPDNTVTCAGITTGGFAGFSGATVTTANFSGPGSIGFSSGVQGLICASNGTMVFNVPLTGVGGIEPQSGFVTLNGVNTYTGNTIVAAGSTLTVGGSGTLGSGSYAGLITNLGGLIFNTTAAQTLSGAVNGAGSITNLGSGILTLTATNLYTGTTMIGNSATLTIGPTGLLGPSGSSFAGVIVNNGTFVYSDNVVAAETLNGAVSGSGTVSALNCAATTGTTAPAGQLSLVGANTYTGVTTITNGYILINSDTGLGTPPASLVPNQLTINMPLNGSIYGLRLQTHSITLNANRGVYLGATGSGVVGGAINVQAGNTMTVAGPISGPGSFSAGCNASFGNGIVVLSNANNTYGGSTFIADGTLALGVNGALPLGTPLTIYTPAGMAATLNMGGFTQTIGPLRTAAALGGSGSATPVITLTGALTVLQTNISTTFGGVISGAGGSLTINTAAGGTPGTLALSAVNTYSGPTAVLGSILALTGSGSINGTPSIAIGAGGTFDVSALSSSTFTLSGSTTISARGTGTVAGSTAATINGASGGVVNLGSQAISLNFTPTSFTGDSAHPSLTVAQGTLTLSGNQFYVTNSGASPLGIGTNILINAPAITGTVAANVVVAGNGIAAGTTAAISISGANVVLIVSAGSLPKPTITHITITGTTLNLSATNGTPNGQYVLLETTNLTLAEKLWTPVLTNSFDPSGNITLSTNIISRTNAVEYFSIQNP